MVTASTRLCIFAVIILGAGAASEVSAADPRTRNVPIAFDIASQPLNAALGLYGDATGREGLYEAGLANGRVSGEVRGSFPPDVALTKLLSSTGLVAEFVDDSTFVLLPWSGSVPSAIAEAVMAVESGFNPNVIGGAGEIGLMQIMPSTARMLGFAGSNAELASPDINIHYGVTYLAQAWRLAAGDLCTATMKYRAGHGETRFSYLSVNYCVAVRAKLAARGFPVTGSVPVATFGSPGGPSFAAGGGCRRRCLGAGNIGHVDLAALNTKLNTLVMQVRAGR